MNSSNSSVESGNTNTLPSKQISPSIHWCFTLNNYTEDDIKEFKFHSSIKNYVFQEETGKNGTPHLQGYIRFKKKTRPKNLFNIRTHWEKCRNVKASIEYCQKKETRTGEVFSNIPRKYEVNIDLRPWQQNIADILNEPPHPRQIHWVWETKGGIGKTTFAKWVFLNYDGVVVLGGKACDMKHQIVQYHNTNGRYPRIIIIDLPRSFNSNYLSYTGIEEIKNMFFFSPKYEGGMVCSAPVHVLIFANETPDFSKFSIDKWVIHNLDDMWKTKVDQDEEEIDIED